MESPPPQVPRPVVRVEDAGLGVDAPVRVVLGGVSDPARLRSPWSSSGASVELVDGRLHATTTVKALVRAAGRALSAIEARAIDGAVRAAVEAWAGPAPDVPLPRGRLATSRRPVVMGVVNVTPDSFSDGGAIYPGASGHPDTAVAHARRLADEGADVLDVGGESTRPGAQPVSIEEELERVIPVVERLGRMKVPVSIDTTKPAVAHAALRAGAQIVNDVSGSADPDLLAVTAAGGAGYVLMHTRGSPRDMQERARYGDVVGEVYEFLATGLERCADAGIDTQRIFVDPGLGFAKTLEHNLELMSALRQLRCLGRPVVVGASRKSFLGKILAGAGPDERLEASLACAVCAAHAGAAVVRVHDVPATVRALRATHAMALRAVAWPEVVPDDPGAPA